MEIVTIAMAGLAVTGGTSIVAVSVYAARTRSTAEAAQHKARNVESALSAHIHRSDDIYARKETLAAELRAIHESLQRIEASQLALTTRLIEGGSSV